MQWSDDLEIETPEQIGVALEIAGLGSRFMAKAVDWFWKGLVIFALGLLVAVSVFLLGGLTEDRTYLMLLVALTVALIFALSLGYDIYFEVRRSGRTPGKQAAGIRVLKESGAAIDFRSSCIRNLLAMADFLPAFYLLGSLLVLLNKRGQRLGDMAAGTIVIRERSMSPPTDLHFVILEIASQEFAFTGPQLANCLPEDRHILRSFFLRYRAMERRARQQLAVRLAELFLHRTTYPLDMPLADDERAEVFLASLYRDMEALAQHGR